MASGNTKFSGKSHNFITIFIERIMDNNETNSFLIRDDNMKNLWLWSFCLHHSAQPFRKTVAATGTRWWSIPLRKVSESSAANSPEGDFSYWPRDCNLCNAYEKLFTGQLPTTVTKKLVCSDGEDEYWVLLQQQYDFLHLNFPNELLGLEPGFQLG